MSQWRKYFSSGFVALGIGGEIRISIQSWLLKKDVSLTSLCLWTTKPNTTILVVIMDDSSILPTVSEKRILKWIFRAVDFSSSRYCCYHRYFTTKVCVGGSTDLLGQSNLDVCRSFDTLVTGRPLAALYLPSLCLTDKLTHVLLFRTIDVALSAHSVR